MFIELPVQITPKALANIKAIMSKKSIPKKYGLRLGTSDAASCGVTNFILGFDIKKTSDDMFSYQGIEILINKKEMLHLIGITLGYEEAGDVSGFKFIKG